MFAKSPKAALLAFASLQILSAVCISLAQGQTDSTHAPTDVNRQSSLDLPSARRSACDELPSARSNDRDTTNYSQLPNCLLFRQTERLTVRGHFQAGINGVFEQNVFWNLADIVVPPVDFDNDPEWLEGYIKPGVSFIYQPHEVFETYGKLSSVISGTVGIDAFDTGNIGRGTFEEGYVGLRSPENSGDTLAYDASFGPRELKLGTGMLIANGGQNGFERGSLKLGPRKSWEFAAIGRLSGNGVHATLFYLDANELVSNDTDTTLAGCDLQIELADQQFVGATYIYVPTSDSPYPKAAPGGIGPPSVIFGAREGLHAFNTYARTVPLAAVQDLFVSGDFAYEQNDRIALRAWGGRLQVGKQIAFLPLTTRLTYSYQTFSGDDPATSRIERFDPLFFEGSPSSWSTGSKSALVFINSNVNSHQLALSSQLTAKDTLTFRYAHIRANELRSPIQFGQATRVSLDNGISTVIAGVVDPHVSDDFFLEYNRIINPNTYLTAGFSISAPGRGIELVAPGQTPIWPGGFLNVVVDY